ncbi:hypothetical protein PPERSA_09088 [Pseudocohnilembus persalinus]|uniref:Uncharacterized protein n=1 Tax=Pseudocohnilembus persalinus TaxID=266149 RepID=A0A0V0Q7Y2_PSEPJ|nr:hypothetical protein PPERSA_09088 [Pseudocohnilembus persalinus]|eukprot:KRW98148.1 hypothetical protein PPERSA_09088 [Pseudocohnilembus persalinus]
MIIFLQIYTYLKNGDQICYKTNDITGYNGENYYYDTIGDQGWAYFKDETNDECHFVFFDPTKCTMDWEQMSVTGMKQGMAESFLNYDNEKILMFEFGNFVDSDDQGSIQISFYEIGSIEQNDKDDYDENAFVIGFRITALILFAFILI